MNKLILCGNVVRKPEYKETANTQLAQFTLAINEGKDLTTFVDCQAWGKTAEIVDKYVDKGHKLLVEGRLSLTEYEGKRYTRCVAERVELINPKKQ